MFVGILFLFVYRFGLVVLFFVVGRSLGVVVLVVCLLWLGLLVRRVV